jgi:hypothetical protein
VLVRVANTEHMRAGFAYLLEPQTTACSSPSCRPSPALTNNAFLLTGPVEEGDDWASLAMTRVDEYQTTPEATTTMAAAALVPVVTLSARGPADDIE